MNLSKTRVLIWVFALAPLVITSALYNSLPDLIPMHWGIGGRVRYDPKMNIWWLAAMPAALAALFTVLPKIDPRKQNYQKFRGAYDGLCLFIVLFTLGIVGVVLSESLNPGYLRIEFVVTAACGVLFSFLGNILPKVKSNFFVGIRTPWTLSSPEVWHRTHRLAGYLWFYGGLALLAASFFLRAGTLFATMLTIVALIILIPVVMSYVWYRK
ncbi:MAG: SdpI family protein [Oscillospiraceae bacterium]|nr:SdpI family protein [Oscillospiraceae bacterium]